MRFPLVFLVLIALPTLAFAQTYPGQSADARSDRISASTAPGTAAANDAAAGEVAARDQARAAMSVADQDRYDADMQAYREARQARRQLIRHDEAYYDRQQRAYAAAMADWRMQAAACRRGHPRACRAPTPRPGDYM